MDLVALIIIISLEVVSGGGGRTGEEGGMHTRTLSEQGKVIPAWQELRDV